MTEVACLRSSYPGGVGTTYLLPESNIISASKTQAIEPHCTWNPCSMAQLELKHPIYVTSGQKATQVMNPRSNIKGRLISFGNTLVELVVHFC